MIPPGLGDHSVCPYLQRVVGGLPQELLEVGGGSGTVLAPLLQRGSRGCHLLLLLVELCLELIGRSLGLQLHSRMQGDWKNDIEPTQHHCRIESSGEIGRGKLLKKKQTRHSKRPLSTEEATKNQ